MDCVFVVREEENVIGERRGVGGSSTMLVNADFITELCNDPLVL